MTILVHIARRHSGALAAWVVQDGVHSNKNLLAKRRLRDVELAKREIVSLLWRTLHLTGEAGDTEFKWQVSEVSE